MRKQRGVTILGWIFLLTPMAIVIYAGIRLAPPYLNYYRVVQALDQTANEFRNQEGLTTTQVHAAIEKRFDTGYVELPKAKDIKLAKNGMGTWELSTDYEETVPMFGNLHLLMQFQKRVAIQ